MIRKLIKKLFHLYDIKDLVSGAHCGCCGRWLPDEIVPKTHTWSLCPKGKCLTEEEEKEIRETEIKKIISIAKIISEKSSPPGTSALEIINRWRTL